GRSRTSSDADMRASDAMVARMQLNARLLPVAVGLVPLFDPGRVQLHVLIEVRQPDLDHLGIETLRIDRRLPERGEVTRLLDHEGLAFLRQAPVEEELRSVRVLRRQRHAAGIWIDRGTFGREENLERGAVPLLRVNDVIEQRTHHDLSAHERIRHRRAGWIEHGVGRGLLFPIILAQYLALEHDARPSGAARRRDDLPDLLVAVFRLGEIHPALRWFLYQR